MPELRRHDRFPIAEAPRRSRLRRGLAVVAASALAVTLTGCGLTIPTDPDGTLATVAHGELRVGAVTEPGLVDTSGATPTGPLPALVEEFAESLDATPEWTVGSEETLVNLLEDGDLDLVVGGFTDETPWIDKAGITRGYSGLPGAGERKLVMLVPLGENAFLSTLETFLDEEADG